MKPLFPALLLASSVLFISSAQAQITWDPAGAGGISPGSPVRAAGIVEIRDAVSDLRADVDAGSGGVWTIGGGGDVYYNGGDVGIGKSNPTVKLDMTGQIRTTSHIEAGNGTGGVALTVNDGQGNANVTFNHVGGVPDVTGNAARIEVNTDATSNAQMYFELGSGVTSGVSTALSTVMRLGADGQVGIGTTNPSARLHVENSGDASLTSTAHALTLGQQGALNLAMDGNEILARNNGVASDLHLQTDGGNFYIRNNAAAGTRFASLNNGNVGIGTNSPSDKLEVAGSIRSSAGRNLYFGTGNQRLHGDNGSAIYADSGHSTLTQMIFRDNEDTTYGRVYGSGNGSDFGLLDGDGHWGIRMNKDNFTSFNLNNTERMRLLANGNLGIGTSSPADMLHLRPIAYSSNQNGGIRLSDTGNNWNARIALKSNGGGSPRLAFDAPNGTEVIAVNNSNNLGIGTSDPAQKLHVVGNSYLQGTVYIGSTDTALYRDTANRITTNDDFYVRSGSGQTLLYSTNTYLGAGSGDTTHLRGNNFTWNQGIIQGNGNVGIGTTNPGAKLDVNGVIRLNDRLEFDGVVDAGVEATRVGTIDTITLTANDNVELETAGTTKVSVTAAGNVGIGTTNPTAQLTVGLADTDGGARHILVNGGGSGNTSGGELRLAMAADYDTTYDFYRVDVYQDDFRIGRAGISDDFVLKNTGNLGIGTTNPSQRLDVNGNINVAGSIVAPEGTLRDNGGGWVRTYGNTGWYSQTYGGGWYMQDSTWIRNYGSKAVFLNNTLRTDGELQAGVSGSRFVVKTNGNVGIGTTNPNRALHVEGAGRVTQNMIVGYALDVGYGATVGYGLDVGYGATVGYHIGVGTTPTGNIAGNSGIALGDNDSGIASPADGTLTFITNNAEEMRLTANGRLGIGTTNPATALHVAGDISLNSNGYIGNNVGEKMTFNNVVDSIDFVTQNTSSMTLRGSRLGIGTTNPANPLHVQASNGGDVLYVYNTNTSDQADGIDVRINRSVPTGGNGFVIFRNSANSIVGSVHGNNAGGVNFLTTSDIRLKDNIESTTYGLDDLMKINVRDFNFKAAPDIKTTGFIAQELNAVYPVAVNPGGDDVDQEPWTVDYSNLTPLLAVAIQDLKQEMDAEISELKNENSKLEARLTALESGL